MKFGIDRLLEDRSLRAQLAGKRVALVAHPASVTRELTHSLDALMACGDIRITAAFGPQHGMRGDKQDNMMETADYNDPLFAIPVFSLYGDVRRPSGQMMSTFDLVLIDLQDVGCRIYTFITTLLYMLEACAKDGKEVWVLDRPNPAGRPAHNAVREPPCSPPVRRQRGRETPRAAGWAQPAAPSSNARSRGENGRAKCDRALPSRSAAARALDHPLPRG